MPRLTQSGWIGKDPSRLTFHSIRGGHQIWRSNAGNHMAIITDCHKIGSAAANGYRFCAGLWRVQGEMFCWSEARAWFKAAKHAKAFLDAEILRVYGVVGRP